MAVIWVLVFSQLRAQKKWGANTQPDDQKKKLKKKRNPNIPLVV